MGREVTWQYTGLEILHEGDFSGERLRREGTYVVCFGALWCPITRRFLPKFVRARERMPGTCAVADVTDRESPLWDTFRIRITPSILVFRHGVVDRRVDGRRFFGITAGALARLEDPPVPGGAR